VALIGYSNQTLQQLIQALDKGLNDSGIPDNKTYFSDTIFWGNLTICRLTHSPGDAFRQQVQELATVKIGEMQVTQIHLVTCNSVCHPQTRTLIGMYSLNNREQ
jgi:2'-5' RNA ligase